MKANAGEMEAKWGQNGGKMDLAERARVLPLRRTGAEALAVEDVAAFRELPEGERGLAGRVHVVEADAAALACTKGVESRVRYVHIW